MGHRLGSVKHRQRAGRRGQRQQRFVRRAFARGVGAGGDRKDARPLVQQGHQVVDMQTPLCVGAQDHELCATALRGHLPWHQVGVMLQTADDDAVAGLQRQAVRQNVQAFRRT